MRLFELLRPAWPETGPESAGAALFRRCWTACGVVYGCVAIVGSQVLRLVLGPAQRPLRWLQARTGASQAGAWFAVSVTTIACAMLSAGALRPAAGAGVLPLVVEGLVAYLGLAAAVWASVWLMVSETNHYPDYPTMQARLGRGLCGWFQRRLRHPSDVLWVRHVAVSAAIHLPPSVAIVLWGAHSWFACAWFAAALLLMPKTGSLDHNVGHHRSFELLGRSRFDRSVGQALAAWYHHATSFLEGDVPYLPSTAHNLVHHAENNGRDDFESTYPYDRTSFTSTALLYLNCAVSYTLGVGILGYLFERRSRRVYRLGFARVVWGLVFTYGTLFALLPQIGPGVLLFVVGARGLQAGLRYGLFAYASHAFIDPKDPTNAFTNSLDAATKGTLMHGGNVHILHHHRQGHHWTSLVERRRRFAHAYAEHTSTVFPMEILPFIQPLLLGKRFDILARWMLDPVDTARYEELPADRPWQPAPSRPGLAALLAQRARPAAWHPPRAVVERIDDVVARLLVWAAGGTERVGAQAYNAVEK